MERGNWGESEVTLRPEALQWKGRPGCNTTLHGEGLNDGYWAAGGVVGLGAPTVVVLE